MNTNESLGKQLLPRIMSYIVAADQHPCKDTKAYMNMMREIFLRIIKGDISDEQ